MRRSKSSLSFLGLLIVTIFTTAVATGKPQVPFQLWGPINSSVYFYHQYIQQPWDAVLLHHQNTMMGNVLQIKYMTQREQWGQVDGCNTGKRALPEWKAVLSTGWRQPQLTGSGMAAAVSSAGKPSEQQISPSRYQLTVNKFRLEIRRIKNPQKEQPSNRNRERLKSN